MEECDPCRFCQYYSVGYDRDFGWDYDCACPEQEFAINGTKPCPYFKQRLPSDGLYQQLADEEEQRYWEEQEKECEKI